jgi:CheY-like chemotaxis protein
VDASQFEQVVMNLVVNARDAMPTGGKLIIETRMVHLDEQYADDHVEVELGDYVVLSISDNGTGMDHDTRLRIFDPFFTTKEQGKGTGLGLSTVYGIVKQSGGHISCYSEPGRGTTFKIYLPVAERGDSVHQKGAAVNLEDCKGDETILLVEDEEAVRAMAKRVLSRAGYTIVEAKDGKEVAERIAELDGPVHLILTDVVLPTLSGREVAEAVRVIYPQAKVLFASGYTDDAIVRYGVLRSEMPFLHKPFTPQALLRKVREVLDSPRSAD